MSKLSDEKVCRDAMEQWRWNGEPFCPHCGGTKPYKLGDGKTYRCREKTCRKDFTVTVGTIFENSKIPLSTWIASIFVITAHKKGISSLQLSRDVGITQKTAWFVLHRIRYIMDEPNPEPLDQIVELDETYTGGKFALMNRARRKKYQLLGIDNKTAVMGFVQRDGKARLKVIGDDSFKDVVRKNVSKEATIITDQHAGYKGLDEEYAQHLSVNHSEMQFRDGIAYTNSVEGFFAALKRSIIGIHHFVSAKHLQKYCNEQSYKYNSRKITDKDRFTQTMCNVEGRLRYKTLIQK